MFGLDTYYKDFANENRTSRRATTFPVSNPIFLSNNYRPLHSPLHLAIFLQSLSFLRPKFQLSTKSIKHLQRRTFPVKTETNVSCKFQETKSIKPLQRRTFPVKTMTNVSCKFQETDLPVIPINGFSTGDGPFQTSLELAILSLFIPHGYLYGKYLT